ncbi:MULTISPECIES: undecaprenyl-diphosphate phosphatase [Marichromatium]|uniref:undecaprenyl-diphosphate phosphatase n=1 Tax=Marichromatium TaxID=85076 RepID=UPI000F41C69C|nr:MULTISPECIES: undecaprenyl-diphosphate phosphatase [Marichromatium]MBK1709338.1 undecaprenyl-diphosphatase [Marichromatium gracile]MBO8085856.1 undecaprenyl-diphosphate phosphatase [Marichromatium sp.]RNE88547.1 undecaprenyl-diphosphate phosphatase [Marichromatium sp. AB31]
MDTLEIILLALVQGITEFLPISSSGHLILTPLLFGFELQELAFDVALHLGTLGAVTLYFRREIARMTVAVLGSLRHRRFDDPDARLGWMIVLATVPVVVLGLPLKLVLEFLRDDPTLIATVIAATSIGFGLLLWWSDWRGARRRDEYSLGWRGALVVGVMQALAIIPGTSRSGITITAGLLLGLTRRAASRFSFLLAIPTILMAGTVEGIELAGQGAAVDWMGLALGAVWSMLFAYLTIHLFLRFIERVSMLPFVLYRVALGGLILLLVW